MTFTNRGDNLYNLGPDMSPRAETYQVPSGDKVLEVK